MMVLVHGKTPCMMLRGIHQVVFSWFTRSRCDVCGEIGNQRDGCALVKVGDGL